MNPPSWNLQHNNGEHIQWFTSAIALSNPLGPTPPRLRGSPTLNSVALSMPERSQRILLRRLLRPAPAGAYGPPLPRATRGRAGGRERREAPTGRGRSTRQGRLARRPPSG